ncbi:MAG: (Fe-S)-binding protein [Bacteroidota bacterium]|nr:(Fe-S)-binding protein [Bacteroidota bacterium]
MTVGLFIPCYINQFYPQVGIATLELLEKHGVDVVYPRNQTCCGQPMANSGFEKESLETYKLFVENFHSYDYIVAPSGSCVYHVREHYTLLGQDKNVQRVRNNTYELCEFLIKILKKDRFNAEFPHRVGLHQSCHGLRGLHLGTPSERMSEKFTAKRHPVQRDSFPRQLLNNVKGIQLVDLDRDDECCGFGGTFAVGEEAVSVKMGIDRINDHLSHHAEVITATDMSCLMHLEGIIRRRKLPVRVKHIAEILNGTS